MSSTSLTSVLPTNRKSRSVAVVEAAVLPAARSTTIDAIHEKFLDASSDMKSAMIERDREVDLLMAGLVANEAVLLIGPPGTGKSMLADAFVRWMDGEKFNQLMGRYTSMEDVFGPISLKGLQADEYRRITAGRMPAANIVFLDEIFKSSSSVLNTLLRILNEGIFENGGVIEHCPIELIIAASNEWPNEQEGGKELGAFFDRFLIRHTVRPVSTARGLDRLMWASDLSITLSNTITPTEIQHARADAATIPWSDEARQSFTEILRRARAEGISPGDRRIRKAIQAVGAHAWVAGDIEVVNDHLDLLTDILWEDPAEQPRVITQIVNSIANPETTAINGLLLECEEILSKTNPVDMAQAASSCKKLNEIARKLAKMKGQKAAEAKDYVVEAGKRLRDAMIAGEKI